jgi:hypothetical protein
LTLVTLSLVTLFRLLCLPVTLSRVLLSPVTLSLGHFVPGHFVPQSLSPPGILVPGALAMVLWYHPCLISERSPVRFPAGCTKTFLSPLPLSPHRLTSYFDVWRHLPSAKICIAQNNIARVNIAPKKTTCSSRPRGGRRRNHNSLLERSG